MILPVTGATMNVSTARIVRWLSQLILLLLPILGGLFGRVVADLVRHDRIQRVLVATGVGTTAPMVILNAETVAIQPAMWRILGVIFGEFYPWIAAVRPVLWILATGGVGYACAGRILRPENDAS